MPAGSVPLSAGSRPSTLSPTVVVGDAAAHAVRDLGGLLAVMYCDCSFCSIEVGVALGLPLLDVVMSRVVVVSAG